MENEESKVEYEHNLILAFWYAVHTENMELSRHILNQNLYIRQLVTLALFRKNENPRSEDPETHSIKKDIFLARKYYER